MMFDSWLDKVLWHLKTKKIQKKFAKGIKLSGDEWNHIAKPYLRQTMSDIKRDCPYEKLMKEIKGD